MKEGLQRLIWYRGIREYGAAGATFRQPSPRQPTHIYSGFERRSGWNVHVEGMDRIKHEIVAGKVAGWLPRWLPEAGKNKVSKSIKMQVFFTTWFYTGNQSNQEKWKKENHISEKHLSAANKIKVFWGWLPDLVAGPAGGTGFPLPLSGISQRWNHSKKSKLNKWRWLHV